MKVLVKRLRQEAKLPQYQSVGASGLDLVAVEAEVIWPRDRVAIGTGLSFEIPAGFEGQIRSRSGLALKRGLVVVNAPGTIDSDYRGEVKVLLHNLSATAQRVEAGDRIAQLVFAPVVQAKLVEAEDLNVTVRGASGFGSTGIK